MSMVSSNPSSDDILKAAFALPEAERLRIGRELLHSVPPPGVQCEGDPGFFEELDRRAEAYADGSMKTYSGEDVRLYLAEKLAEDRKARGV
ncbi:MAG: hypothetical protein AAF266_11755 [Planctomycetota bacterium]